MTLAQHEFANLAIAQLAVVYRNARRLSRDDARADDLVQDTFLRAIRFQGTYELREFGIRPWLLRILRGVHCDQLHREMRQRRTMDEDGEYVRSATSLPVHSHDPLRLEMMDERLVKAINSLSAPFREALLLWALEDLTYQEIAEKLNVPLGTVMSRLHRARKLVRERIGDRAAKGEGWQ